jgi:hypothetical protein
MRRKLITVAILVTALLGFSISAAFAFNSKELQSQASTPLCADANGTSGDSITGKSCSGGNNQIFSSNADNICNGSNKVTDGTGNDCPFLPGLGLDQKYVGDPIVTIPNVHYGTIWQSTGVNTDIVQVNSGSMTAWVIDGTCSVGFGCSLVNVAASNTLNVNGNYESACSEGAGSALKLEDTPTANKCVWQAQ